MKLTVDDGGLQSGSLLIENVRVFVQGGEGGLVIMTT